MIWSPRVTVAAIICRDGHYLMVEEAPDGLPVLNQPAGHLEFGETLLEAVRREVLEETGHPFEPLGLTGVYQWTLPDSECTFLRFCFTGEVGERLPHRALDPDIVDTHWLTLAQISGGQRATRSPLVVRCIEDALAAPATGLEHLHALD
jgi:8-oxo-dGTP pyrophosphatase MutT (NUDIX family)